MKKLTLVFLVVIQGIVNQSCVIVKPEKPAITQKPIPTTTPLSSVSIPIEASLQPLFDDAEQSLPKEMGADEYTISDGNQNAPGCHVGLGYKVWRSPINFSPNNSADLAWSTNLKYWVHARKRVGCIGPINMPFQYLECGNKNNPNACPGVSVSTTTHFRINKDYSLAVDTDNVKVSASGSCYKSFGPIRIDFTDKIVNYFKEALNKKINKLDTDLESALDIESHAGAAWHQLSMPIELEGKNYLSLNPSAVFLQPTYFSSDRRLVTGVTFELRPTIVRGNAPEPQEIPLPAIGDAPVTDKFSVSLPVSIALERVNADLLKHFKKEDNWIPFPRTGRRKIYIKGVKVDYYGEKTSLELSFKGTRSKGVVYLVGTPAYERSSKKMYFKDLALSAESNSILIDKAAWIANEIPAIKAWIESNLVYDVSTEIEEATNIVHNGLNSTIGNVKLFGTLDNFELTHVNTSQDEIKLLLEASGNLKAVVQN